MKAEFRSVAGTLLRMRGKSGQYRVLHFPN